MVVEEDAEKEEDEEEKKVQSKQNNTFKIPQKLQEFRQQAAAKELKGK